MKLDELKANPLNKRDLLFHTALGVCTYAGKVRGSPEEIHVNYTDFKGQKGLRIRVNIADVRRERKAGKMQGQAMFAVLCPQCSCLCRVSRKWLSDETGAFTRVPLCWNPECPEPGQKMEVQTGENGGAILGQDMSYNPPQIRDGISTGVENGEDLDELFNRERRESK